ncbi:cytochrome P450 [Daedalea quercina L-15889]|uniref:Cytochrome P450 n=1 Tax=Daedalea quercina L-15889 TaxID=1314783 RepID=A0A165MTB0_9APHY|nr:cytochrome P450 [Daedalea quercina L-15889]
MGILPIFYAFAGLAALYALASRVRPNWRSLAHIPTVGGPPFPILSYIGTVRFFSRATELLEEGYSKHKDGLFKHAEAGRGWRVVVCSPKLIEDVRKASEDQLSFRAATNEALQASYTIGPSVQRNPYHVQVIRANLTTNESLSGIFSDMFDEMIHAFEKLIPVTDDWTCINAHETVIDIICRTSNRIFVGLPLCRNEGYCELNKRFTFDLFIGGLIVNWFPKVFKPTAVRLLTNVPNGICRGSNYLRGIIEERLEHEPGEKWEDKPNDMLQWLIDGAQGEERSVHALVKRMLVVNFAAIHTTSITFTQALLLLAAHPEHLPALREEVEAAVREEGWTKAALNRMRRVDSFLRETQRFAGLGAISMARKALQDFTFSDGTFIPAGTFVDAPSHSLHHDGRIYKNPHIFDPFRFASSSDEGTRYQMVATSTDYIPFGHGRHACPGRFFVAIELKTMLAHIAVTYDIKLERAGDPPLGRWIGASLVPDRKAEVLFRKRRD